MGSRKKSLIFGLVVILVASLLLGCPNMLSPGGDDDEDNNGGGQDSEDNNEGGQDSPQPVTDISEVFSVNLDGAEALVTRSVEEVDSNTLRTSTISARSATSSPLAKILEDGSVEDVFDVSQEGFRFPDIRFIAVGPDESIYVYFNWTLEIWGDNHDGPEFRAQFIQITPDERVLVIEEDGWIPEFNWNWGAGANQKPVVFDDDGGIYYAIDNNNSMTLKRYANGETKELTSAGDIDIQAFFTDGTNLFYLARNRTQDNTATFLRRVSRDGSSTNIFYNQSGNVWIRAVEKTSTGLLIHGDGIPNPADDNDSYSGLLRLIQEDGGSYTWETVIGSSNEDTQSEIRFLKRSIFENDSGEVDFTVLDAMAKRFFVGGNVPDNVDYFAEVQLDRESDRYVELNNHDDAYFWYELLNEYDGFDPEFFDIFTDNNNWHQVFQAGTSEELFDYVLYSSDAEQLSVNTDNAILLDDSGEAFDTSELLVRLREGNSNHHNQQLMASAFDSIELKPSVTTIPSVYTYPRGNLADWDLSVGTATIDFIDTYFDYEVGDASVYGIGTLDSLLNPITDSNTWQNGTQVKADYLDDPAELLQVIEIDLENSMGGGINLSLTWKENPDGHRFDPSTDIITGAARDYPIEWQWEAAAGTSHDYPNTGILGQYRVLDSSAADSKWMLANLIDGIPSEPDITDGNEIQRIFQDGSDHSLYAIRLDYIESIEELTEKLVQATNMAGLTMKSVPSDYQGLGSHGGGAAGNTLWSLRDHEFSHHERGNEIEWEWEGDPEQYTYDRTGLLGNYRIVQTDRSSDAYFVTNFFEVEKIGYPNFWLNTGDYTTQQDFSTPDEGYRTAAELLSYFNGHLSTLRAESITPKDTPADGTGWTLERVPWEVVNHPVEWAWEGDGTESYDRIGPLGAYRVLDGDTHDPANFLYNLFDITPRSWDLTDDGDIRQIGRAFFDSLFGSHQGTRVVQLQSRYLHEDGSLKTAELESMLNRYTASATVDEDLSDKLLLWNDYRVTDDSGNEDWEATRKEIAQTFLDYEPLPEFPNLVVNRGMWDYTTGPWDSSSSLTFHNLDRFTVSDATGEVIGMFHQGDWNSNTFAIVRLLDTDGNAVQEILKDDIKTSSLKLVGSDLYYTESDSSGNWRLVTTELHSDAVEQELIGFEDNLELFKYDIATPLNRIYFTAGSTTQAGRSLVGTIDLLSSALSYNESTAGVGAGSDLTIYTAD